MVRGGRGGVAHPRDPYHRVDVLDTGRRVRISLDGETLGETSRAKVIFEAGLPPRWYLPREDVRMDLLAPSDSHTICAYKGQASYFSYGDAADMAWSYEDPRHEAAPVRDLLCFYVEHTDYVVDGERIPRPVTDWSRSRT